MRYLLIILALIFSGFNSFPQTNWIGKKAPEIIVEKWINTSKSSTNLSIENSGKSDFDYIILEFWAPNSPSAIAHIPFLNEIAKEFDNVQILSVTFKDENSVKRFLEKTQLNYPIGIDTSHKTISNYNIKLYPTTLIIDRNGIVIWQDVLYYQSLNKYLLKEILNGGQLYISKDPELDKDEKLYSLTIKENTLDTDIGSYYEYGPYLISVVNKDLGELLKTFFKINRSRILDFDSTFLTKRYDITFQASKNIRIENNCTEAIKWLLPKELKFQPQSIFKDTTFFVFNVINDSLLNTHISQRKRWSGETRTRNGKWIGKGARFKNVKDFLENQFNILIDVDIPDTVNYDFVLSLTSMEMNLKILRDKYGTELTEKQGSIEMWRIIK